MTDKASGVTQLHHRYGLLPAPRFLPPPTHTGPDGPVRARTWSGLDPNSIVGFLDGPGNAAWWFDGPVLTVDTEDGALVVARPGDWLVWAGPVLHVIPADQFTTDYQPR